MYFLFEQPFFQAVLLFVFLFFPLFPASSSEKTVHPNKMPAPSKDMEHVIIFAFLSIKIEVPHPFLLIG